MARRKKRSSSRCKIVTVNGRRRKLCWGRGGKLTSNRPASGSTRRKRKSTKSSRRKKPTCKFGRVKSGPRKGRCRKRRVTATKRRRTTSRKRQCKFGVNKNNGKCLKARRRK